jgi:protein-S-isoprenylcysteine O-methyltransferase Ste14
MSQRIHGLSKARNQLAQLAAVAVLSVFYGGIAIHWVSVALRHSVLAGPNHSNSQQALIVMHAVSTAIFYAAMALLMFTRKKPVRREKRVIAWILPTSVLLVGVMGVQPPRDNVLALSVVSTIFIVGGTIMTLYALRHLGRHFGVVSDVRGLVTSGPYRLVRHPLYAAETITLIGLLLAAFSPLSAGILALTLALQVTRAKIEEQALEAAFPEYREYASRTPMIVPLAFSLPIVWRKSTPVV